ncbi:MAG TPA: tetraacyldisaccharide 4'-kinase [Steroidobacteraceae bacterium]|nr:tetraacyldisaccharide 4'-kinase [Steroidobacteraceae bacterium]
MQQRLIELWYRPQGGASLLQPLGWAYGAVVRTRRAAYAHGWLKVCDVGKPLVVVGNLTVGGTGKTPLTIWLAERLKERGLVVGVVSRGYGRAAERHWQARRGGSRGEPLLVQADSRWQEVGDEPLLIRRHTGCLTAVAADRLAAALHLAQAVDVIVSDDGLQHLRLARDCEIALVDGARGFGNGRLLPAGPLREPASRLEQVDVIVVNGAAEHASLRNEALSHAGAIFGMRLLLGPAQPLGGGSSVPLEHFSGDRVHAVAGIGHPRRFFRDLAARGLEVIEHPFPDHHPFVPEELAFPDDRPILMTEKDAVRCTAFATSRMWLVPVDAHLEAPDARALLERVSRRIDAARARKR